MKAKRNYEEPAKRGGGRRGETLFHSAQFNPSAVKEDGGRARLNGSMRKRGVFEVG